MIRTHVWENEQLTTVEGPEGLRIPTGDARTWFILDAPTAAEAAAVVAALPLHELTMADALKEGHPPKFEEIDDFVFVIGHTPVGAGHGRTRKIGIFLGATWVLSVHRVPIAAAQEVEARVLKEPGRFLGAPERILHALMDHMMDAYEKQVEQLSDRTAVMEDDVIRKTSPDILEQILRTRRQIGRLARTLRSQRDVCLTLSRTNHAVLSRRITPYMRDLYDHCLRANDLLEGVHESLAAIRDTHLANVNNRLSETMRVLTVIATIMMPLSLLAGIFGMNFDPMPMVKTPWGFWTAAVLMVGVAVGMVFWFRRRGWL